MQVPLGWHCATSTQQGNGSRFQTPPESWRISSQNCCGNHQKSMTKRQKRQKMAKGTKRGHLHCFTTGTASECGHHRQVSLTCCLAVSQQKLFQWNWWFHDGIPPKVDDSASGLTNHYCAPPEAPELKRTLVTLASLTVFHHNSCNTCIYNISLLSNHIFAVHHDLSNPESTSMRGVTTIPEQSSASGAVRQNACLQSSKTSV